MDVSLINTYLAFAYVLVSTAFADSDGDLRLSDGAAEGEGRVEVYYQGQWGTVCDDVYNTDTNGLDNTGNTGRVMCRQLGFETLVEFGYQSLGDSTLDILMDDLVCTGDESRITECSHRDLGSHDCVHLEDIWLRCADPIDGDLRLSDGAAGEGRVEVYYQGQWGTVCDDVGNTNNTGRVMCRQLGYQTLVAFDYQSLGDSTLDILLDNLMCTGNESRITECSHLGFGSHNCDHSEDIWLRCADPIEYDGDLRLSGGAYQLGDPVYEGLVEVYYQGVWGTICDDSFDSADAQVVCRQLGYGTVLAYDYSSGSTATGEIWLDDVACTGSESRIDECSHNGWGQHDCVRHEDVFVRCSDAISDDNDTAPTTGAYSDGDLRLSGGWYQLGDPAYEGLAEVYYQGVWGTICDDSFDSADAQVVCRQLGYGTVVEYGYSSWSIGTGEIWLDDVACTGSESRIDECSHNGWGYHDCVHSEDVFIRCSNDEPTTTVAGGWWPGAYLDGDLRLSDGAAEWEGRVEVYYQGQWGTVCDDVYNTDTDGLIIGVDPDNTGRVMCRQLGFETLVAFGYQTLGDSTLNILLDDLVCTGDESRITECSHRDFGSHDCTHLEDIWLRCAATQRACLLTYLLTSVLMVIILTETI